MRIATVLPLRTRLQIAIAVGVLSGAWIAYLRFEHPQTPSDLSPVLWGAQAWLHGENPFQVVAESPVWSGGLLYPFTAVLAVIPLALLPEPVVHVLWAVCSAGLLTWVLLQQGITPRIVMLISPALVHALNTSQWTPLLLAATLSTWGGMFLACKPTTAIWLFAYRPRWQHAAGAAVLIVLSLISWPAWPVVWRAELAGKAVYTVWPLLLPGAPLVLLAVLRWRRPEARLLLAMACVPHTMLIYETLPLFLIARTWTQSAILWMGSVAVAGLHNSWGPYRDATEWVTVSGRLIVWLMYLPALVMVLVRTDSLARRNTSAFDSFLRARPALGSATRTSDNLLRALSQVRQR